MTDGLSPTLLAALSNLIEAQMGLHYPPERWPALEEALAPAALELGFPSLAACTPSLLRGPLTKSQIAILAGHLTIGETYFRRDAKLFTVLEKQILPELIRERRSTGRRLRLWSAGCCSGEEPYSLAILVHQLLPDWRDWNITILATDINAGFLRKAVAGQYGSWSFRDTSPELQARWFHRRPAERFEIRDEIKAAVTFAPLNLSAEATYPSLLTNTNAMDVIVCRNVLLYFSPETASAVVRNLHRSLAEGGWLLVAPADASPDLFPLFQTIRSPAGFLYRKGGSSPPPARPPAAAASLHEGTAAREMGGASPAQPVAAPPAPSESAEVVYARAATLFAAGRYEAAATALRDLCEEGGGPPAALALLARSHANQGNLAAARQCTETAIAADKLNAPLHYLLATIIQEEGDVDAAVRSLERALYLDQDFVLAHFTLGNLTLRQGRPQRARKHFENTVDLLSRYPPGELLPESEGLTAGRLMQIVRAIQMQGAP